MLDVLRRVVRPCTSKYEAVKYGLDNCAAVVVGIPSSSLFKRNRHSDQGRFEFSRCSSAVTVTGPTQLGGSFPSQYSFGSCIGIKVSVLVGGPNLVGNFECKLMHGSPFMFHSTRTLDENQVRRFAALNDGLHR
jgi:hypothetical protein